jgi:threonine dehydrogenase-like Zn-dependent dehydrogenase
MAKTRRIGALDGTGHGLVLTQDVPELGKGRLLVKVHASLISPGTELGKAKQDRKDPKAEAGEPRPFGYQDAGEVLEVGEGVDEFQPGDRVACMGGGYAQHTNYAVVPKNLCARMPDNVSYEEAAFCHLAATALHAVRRAEPQFGENVAVAGLGTVGQLAAQLARLCGTHVVGLDRFPMRLEVAADLGADLVVNVAAGDPVPTVVEFCRGHGLDAGIVAFGGDATECLRQLYAMMQEAPDTHRWGRVVVVGGATVTVGLAASLGNVDIRISARTGPGYHDEPWEHGDEYPDVIVKWHTRRNLEECLRAMAEGRLEVRPLISDIFPLDEAPAACEKIVSQPAETLAVILKPGA